MKAHESKVQAAKGLQFRGRVVEAEAVYREVLREEPGRAEALEGLGVLVFHQGRAAEAADLFASGVAIYPDSARFHANLGEALRSTGRVDEALIHLRRATELDRSLPHAWNSLALLAQSQARFADAAGIVPRGDQAVASAHRGLHQPRKRTLRARSAGPGGRCASRGARVLSPTIMSLS